MNLFDKLVTDALTNQPHLSLLRIVVEKELLHHDILRVLSDNQLLTNLTFIGGTCLRSCYGGIRLSEDLDFTGGHDFTRDDLSTMSDILIENLNNKYGLHVEVSEPIKNKKNVDTWKIKVITRPAHSHIPAQCINVDICAVPSYEKCPMMILNPYGVDMGTSGLIVQAQSREEIYTDKLIAFALRPNRIKYRDLWDIVWLHQQGLTPKIELISDKLCDRQYTLENFLNAFNGRKNALSDEDVSISFKKEMARFLPVEQIQKVIDNDSMWPFIIYLITDLERQVHGLA